MGGYGIPEVLSNSTGISVASLVLAVKACLVAFTVVWLRATLPRIRFTDLLEACWTMMLPVSVALVLFAPSMLVAFEALLSHLVSLSP